MTGALVTKEDAITAMRVLATLAAQAAAQASDLALHAAKSSPGDGSLDQHRNRVAGCMDGARFAANRAATYGAAVTAIAKEVF